MILQKDFPKALNKKRGFERFSGKKSIAPQQVKHVNKRILDNFKNNKDFLNKASNLSHFYRSSQ